MCLTISFVSSSHALMSSALIPLLSADLPFFLNLLIAVCNSFVAISDSHHLTRVFVLHIDAALFFMLIDFLFSFFMFIVVYFFVEFMYGSSQLRSYSNHSQDTGCTIMDDFMTKADDLFPTQTQIENLTLQPNGLNAQRVRATNKRCACATRETRTQTAQGIHNSM